MTMATTELIPAPRTDMVRHGDVRPEDFLPVLSVKQAVERKEMMNQFITGVMREKEDFGTIPGAGEKKVLLKPGAEKLCSIFGLTPQYTTDSLIEDWTGENHGGEAMFYYAYKCALSRGGRFMGEAIGSCSSRESRYRYRWVREDQLPAGINRAALPSRGGKRNIFEPDFAIDKADTTGKYGKAPEYWQKFKDAITAGTARQTRKKLGPKEYDGWEITVDELQYRIPNPDVADIVNTVQKIAQKRALVAAVLIVTNASDAFTQDVEDFEDERPSARMTGSASVSSGGYLFDDEAKPQPHSQPSPAAATTSPAETPIPAELSDLFRRIDSGERGAVPNAFHLMEQAFKELNCPEADGVYEDLKIQFRNRFPTGGKNKANGMDIKTCLLGMWGALQRWEQNVEHVKGGM
jgi:hypothetical protein